MPARPEELDVILPPELQELHDQLDAVVRDAHELTAGLAEADAAWAPQPGAWSVAQCLDHLGTANRVYLGAMEPPAALARKNNRFRRGPARPGLVGGWFVRSMEPPVKMRLKTYAIITPRPSPPLADAMSSFLTSQDEVRRFLRANADLDLASIHFPNPFIRGVRFSLATGLHVILAHERRHLWQAWRARKAALARNTRASVAALLLLVFTSALAGAQPPNPTRFVPEEATVSSIHAALSSRQATCVQVTQAYLNRIDAYDHKGPALNAILSVNPRALDTAAEMDRLDATTVSRRPLHCIPVVLKDNYDTADMPTTGGSVTLAKLLPAADGFVVKRLRAAGAIILAKANLMELAWSGTTVSSLGGQTRNPYDLTRTPGGSSGGTGAAIAANFGVLGTGSDTGQSIRSPSSANSLVGVRPTRGLVSRAGMIPLSMTQDAAGPITRTVEDAARMLEVMAGYDPDDPPTAFSTGKIPPSYSTTLTKDGLKGARLGLLVDFLGHEPIHDPVNAVVEAAAARMSAMGATIVRVSIPSLDALTRDLSLITLEFKAGFNAYLAGLGARAPVKNLDEFIASGEFHPALRSGLLAAQKVTDLSNSPEYMRMLLRRNDLRQAVMTLIAANRLDAVLYPHQRRLVVPIGEEQVERNGVLSNSTGFPAVTFPGGFSPPTASAPIGVPVGLEILGPEWSEPLLLKLAFAYQEGARVRKPPASTPALR
jgi:amidase